MKRVLALGAILSLLLLAFVPAFAEWQAEWEKTLNAAEKEKKLVMYSSTSPGIKAELTKAMKEKYGLEIEYVSGRGVELHQKALSERRAGLFNADVYMGGMTIVIAMLLPEGVMDPIRPELILPEVVDTKNWYGNTLPIIDKGDHVFGFSGSVLRALTINTNLVKAEEITSFGDLLKPKFKGKMAMSDPTIGSASAIFVNFAAEYAMGHDFIKELAKQDLFISRDERLLAEWVARGKYSVLIGTRPDAVADLESAGAPLLGIIPKEGSCIEPGSGSIVVYNKRPHPAATRVFLNWLLSKEGQTVYSKAAGTESARLDVPNDHLPSHLIRQPGQKYVFADEQFHKMTEKNLEFSKEVFGPLIK